MCHINIVCIFLFTPFPLETILIRKSEDWLLLWMDTWIMNVDNLSHISLAFHIRYVIKLSMYYALYFIIITITNYYDPERRKKYMITYLHYDYGIPTDTKFHYDIEFRLQVRGKLPEVCRPKRGWHNKVQRPEKISYYQIGITIHGEFVLDQPHVIKNLNQKLENLVSIITVLRPDQKLFSFLSFYMDIINQFIWPTLVYPQQCALLNKIPKSFLEDVDKILRSAVKEILMLPSDIPNAMLYSSPSNNGLIKASREA
jgi:hypothetical protein